jgi:uncharacterized protein YgbK (DUF1537 family)
MPSGGERPVVVLDDDPTGVQTLSGIRVLLRWNEESIRRALDGRRSVHLITNSRARTPEEAERLVGGAARTANRAAPGADIVLRGDSTLRGHLLEEYLGVRDAVTPGGHPVLLLVPALPTAGRVTIGGVHLIEREGARTPLHDTEYARDGVFAYTQSRLLSWAQERSHGLFPADEGIEIHGAQLRAEGAACVAAALSRLSARGRPAALVPDAERLEDLELIAAGLRDAVTAGALVVVRCAPALAGVLGRATASGHVPPPSRGGGVLVVCGSYVPTTTRQLAALVAAQRIDPVEADVEALAATGADAEVARLARASSESIAGRGLALLATPRTRPAGTDNLVAGERIASGLARVLQHLDPRPSVVIVKGGITSAVTLHEGVGATEADVVGPILPGVSLWAATWRDGTPVDYVVVPGNVGDERLLAELVQQVMEG